MQTMTATAVKRNFDKVLENIQNDYEPIFVVGSAFADCGQLITNY